MKGKLLDKFEYRENTDDRLCIIACLGKYHSRQNNLEGLKPYQLIAIFKKLFKGVYTDIMRRRRKDLFAIKNIVDFFHTDGGLHQENSCR